MSSTLLGVNRVSESEVIAVPDVPYTRTFHPVHHREVLKVMREAVGIIGLEVVKEEYVLAAEGKKMFTVWDLNNGNSEMCWSIGIRNSMNKSMSLGITAGTRVFVCENLCFSGDFVALRRHTAGLTNEELCFLAFRTVRRVIPMLERFALWHKSLRQYPLTEEAVKILMVEFMVSNVMPPSKFNKLNELYHDVYVDNSLWSAHEAATDVLKTSNLLTLPQKNKALNQVINNYIDCLDSAGSVSSSLGDFYENRALMHT